MNTRRVVRDLAAQLDGTRLDLAMWRMDQLTRRGSAIDSMEPRDISMLRQELKDRPLQLRTLNEALGSDWSLARAPMHDVYYFAQRVYEWLRPDRSAPATLLADGMLPRSKVRLLNNTFAHRLLAMFLDHRVVACRLRATEREPTYYATYFGVFDQRYTELVEQLYLGLRGRQATNDAGTHGAVWWIPKKRAALISYLASNQASTPRPDWDQDAVVQS